MKKQIRVLLCMVITVLLISSTSISAFASSEVVIETKEGLMTFMPVSEDCLFMSDGKTCAIISVQETREKIDFILTKNGERHYIIYEKATGKMYSLYTKNYAMLQQNAVKTASDSAGSSNIVLPMSVKRIVETTEYKVSYAQIAEVIGDVYDTYDLAFTIVAIIGVFQGVALTTITAALYGALKGAILTTILDGIKNNKPGGVKLQIHLCEITKHQGGRIVTGYGYKLGDVGVYR